MAQPQDQTGNVTKQKLIELGRPNGPDLQLKFNPNLELQPAANATGGIIRIDSSITEVLNVLSFLISTDRTFGLVEAENSAATAAQAGQINPDTGYYTDAALTGFQDLPPATFNITDFTLIVPAGDIHFPVSILKRRGDADTANPNNPNKFTPGMNVKLVTVGTAEGEVKALFSDCVKQMIYILNKTRTILGPTGWTDLFQKISGGSSANKKAKRTHRHRRRYSSKQY
jgi:hypothetical protein